MGQIPKYALPLYMPQNHVNGLLAALDRLTSLIRSSEGRTNKDLAKLTDQITELCNKFEK